MKELKRVLLSMMLPLIGVSFFAHKATAEFVDGFPEGCAFASIAQPLPQQFLRYGVIRWYEGLNNWSFLYMNDIGEYVPVEIADNVGRMGAAYQQGVGAELAYGTPRDRYVVAQILDRDDIGLNPIVTCVSNIFRGEIRFGVRPYAQDYWLEYERYRNWKWDTERRDKWLYGWRRHFDRDRLLWKDKKWHRSKPLKPITILPVDRDRDRKPFKPVLVDTKPSGPRNGERVKPHKPDVLPGRDHERDRGRNGEGGRDIIGDGDRGRIPQPKPTPQVRPERDDERRPRPQVQIGREENNVPQRLRGQKDRDDERTPRPRVDRDDERTPRPRVESSERAGREERKAVQPLRGGPERERGGRRD